MFFLAEARIVHLIYARQSSIILAGIFFIGYVRCPLPPCIQAGLKDGWRF